MMLEFCNKRNDLATASPHTVYDKCAYIRVEPVEKFNTGGKKNKVGNKAYWSPVPSKHNTRVRNGCVGGTMLASSRLSTISSSEEEEKGSVGDSAIAEPLSARGRCSAAA